ncbi:MAG: MG2 domain-containing protein, partial [Comamonas sp.]
ETVSMKHYLRALTGAGKNSKGFDQTPEKPDRLTITHLGSGQRFTQALSWSANGSAISEFPISKAAKLGEYSVELSYENGNNSGRRSSFSTGVFRVEEFRLPVMEGRVGPASKDALYGASSVPAEVQINYVSGGAASNLPVKVSALLRSKSPDFSGWDGFSFNPPRSAQDVGNSDDEESTASDDTKVVADKLPVTLDKNGLGKVTIDKLPKSTEPRELLMEATYADPNGEVQTLRGTRTIWPAAVVAGVRSENWISVDRKLSFQALTLDT